MAFTCKLFDAGMLRPKRKPRLLPPSVMPYALQMRRGPVDFETIRKYSRATLRHAIIGGPIHGIRRFLKPRQRKRYAIFHKEIAAAVQRFARTVGDR